MERVGRVGTMAFKIAIEKLGHWARMPFLSDADRVRSFQEMEESIGAHLFEGLAKLRGTAAKLGQIASMETGFLPEAYRVKLEALQSSSLPLSYAIIRKVIQADFGRPPEDVFKEFDSKPFASASLGQVHQAVLHSGEKVAVKVLFPGVKESIKSDFKMVRALFSPLGQNKLVLRTLEELQERIFEETDYKRELENATWFFENVKLNGVRIPKVYPEFSSAHVITSELISGTPLTKIESAGVGQLVYDLFKHLVFNLGVVHADPHAGNYLVLDDGSCIALVDYGAVRREFRPQVLELFTLLFSPNASMDTIVNLYGEMGADLGAISTQDFYTEIVDPYRSKLLGFVSSEQYSFDTTSTLARDLRMALFAHAFHPRLQNFSAEFTLLHRTFYGVISLLERQHATIRP